MDAPPQRQQQWDDAGARSAAAAAATTALAGMSVGSEDESGREDGSNDGDELALVGAIDQGTTSTRFFLYRVHVHIDPAAQAQTAASAAAAAGAKERASGVEQAETDLAGEAGQQVQLEVVASHQMEFSQIHPHAGWVEHDPMEILATVRECMARAIDKAQASLATLHTTASAAAAAAARLSPRAAGGAECDAESHSHQGGRGGEGDGRRAEARVAARVAAVGLTNQRETTVVWRRSTGKPLYNAIVWMDARTAPICRRLEAKLEAVGGRDALRQVTGLPISTYFSAVKLLWLLENVSDVQQALAEGDALFGTIDTWILWNMTGGAEGGANGKAAAFVTDCSNASRTLMMELRTRTWHEPTLEVLGVPRAMLPAIVSNAERVGTIAHGWPLAGVVLAGCLGDQHAAMLGQRCHASQAKATYGTGCFILLNTGEHVCASAHGLLSTVAFQLGAEARVHYALEGSIAIAGAAVQWLRDSLGVIASARDVETLACQVDSTGGVYFVPAFSGLLAPRWREDARGVLVGISRYTTKHHIARAVLEAIAFQVHEVLDAMQSDAGGNGGDMPSCDDFVLRVDGGAAVNNLLLQIQADVVGCRVVRPGSIETTAMGAALAAGLAVGLFAEHQLFAGHGPASPSTATPRASAAASLSAAAEAAERELSEGVREGEMGGVKGVAAGLAAVFVPHTTVEERDQRFASWCTAVERSYGLAHIS